MEEGYYMQTHNISLSAIKENIYITFRSFRNEARTNNANGCYSRAIEWYEKAFDFGLKFQDRIEAKEIQEIAFWLCDFAISLPRRDKNFTRPIHVARKFLKYFSKDKEGLEHALILAWGVLEEYKPIAESLCIEDQQALQLLEHEKNRYPHGLNKNNYLRN